VAVRLCVNKNTGAAQSESRSRLRSEAPKNKGGGYERPPPSKK